MRFFTGTVYTKALAIFLAAALGLLGTVAALTQLVILREFDRSEKREVRATLQRVLSMLIREFSSLQSVVQSWEEPFSPAMNAGSRPDQLPISPKLLNALRVDFVAEKPTEESARLVFGGAETKEAKAIIDLLEGPAFLNWSAQDGDEAAFAVVDDKLCAFAIQRIRDSEGLISRVRVAGSILDRDDWESLALFFSATLGFERFKGEAVNDGPGRTFLELLTTQEVVVDAADEGLIIGYRLIKGMDGLPLGYVTISQPRPLRQEGLHAIQIFLSGIGLAGGALVLVVWMLLDRTILARIKDLTRKLEREKRSGRLPVKLEFRGRDELGVLARSIEDLAGLLESTQSLYRAILEDQTDLICRFDASYRVTFANSIFSRSVGCAELAPGVLLMDLLPPSGMQAFQEQFAQLTRSKSFISITREIQLNEQNRPAWFRSTLRKSFDNDGNITGGQWVLGEITALVVAQKKMIDAERRFRRLFESAADGLLLVDGANLTVLDINPSLCRLLMVSGGEVLGMHLAKLPMFTRFLPPLEQFLRGGLEHRNVAIEARLQRGDETSVFAEVRFSGYEAEERTIVQLAFRNIMDRVLNERELRRLSAKLLRLQDEERRRIARELHDSTAQNLSALEINLSILEPMADRLDTRAADLVRETRSLAEESSKELRNISYLLHPPLIDEVGLAFAINWFADGFSKRTGIATTVEIAAGFSRLVPDVEMPLFRVVQEGLTNVYRHSGADRAWVRIHVEGESIILEIRDNGRGFADGLPDNAVPGRNFSGGGVGLAGMRERLANIGATLDIENSPLGVTLIIRLRINQSDLDGSMEESLSGSTS